MRSSNLGLYQPGNSWLHRLPAGAKLATLVLFSAGLIFAQRSLIALATSIVLILLAYASAGIGPRLIWWQVKPILAMAVFIGAMHALTRNWHNTAAIPMMLVSLVMLAALVTLTTRTTALIDVITKCARPFARFGVDPERVGLTMLLGIRCVPLISGLASKVKEAQIARCGVFDMRAFAVPLIISAIRDADAVGEALIARGFDD
ncbi:MAG: energy-coupling factor transporter transmembrane protein EcfT [Propionibacteriaceae bacterium]|jgi:biotin transport system permease protein|nr:energy-coupling factor transporter transmembrane protein EcfT [Propionibacteriaceae bacterium]